MHIGDKSFFFRFTFVRRDTRTDYYSDRNRQLDLMN